MPFSGMNPTEEQNQLYDMAQNAYVPQPEAPGMFEGIPSAIGRGFEKGELGLLNLGLSAYNTAQPEESGLTDDNIIRDAMNKAHPDPTTTGAVANIAYGLSSGVAPLVVGSVAGGLPGAIGLLATTSGVNTAQETYEKTKDVNTALKVGAVDAVQNAAMGLLPGTKLFPTSIVGRIVTNAASLGVIGSTGRASTASILENAGYHDMAQQYKWNDNVALLTDIIMGGFMGIHEHPTTEADKVDNVEQQLPSDTDTGLYGSNVNQLEIDAAPGIPTDMETRNAHVDTMSPDNMAKFVMGEDIDTSKVEEHGQFVAKPETPQETIAREELEKTISSEENPTGHKLSPVEDEANEEQPTTSEKETVGAENASNEEPISREDQLTGTAEESSDVENTDLDYQTKLAQQITTEKPETMVPTHLDDDGNVQSVSADDALKQEAEAEAQDKETQSFIQQAIECALRFGGLE